MTNSRVYLVLILMFLPNKALPLSFLRELFSPRVPMLNRVRVISHAKSFDADYAVLDFVSMIISRFARIIITDVRC